jgi:hypothetical protein
MPYIQQMSAWMLSALMSTLFNTVVFEDRFASYTKVMMSYPSTELICGKCGTTISKVINLRPVRDVLRTHDGKCRMCGINLNPADFTIEIEKI